MSAHGGKRSVKGIDFKKGHKGSLYGFVELFIPEMRLRIFDATVHESHGRRWVNLPARPQVGSDGQVRRDVNGRAAYSVVLQFADRQTSDAFSARVIAALLERDPDAFDDGAMP